MIKLEKNNENQTFSFDKKLKELIIEAINKDYELLNIIISLELALSEVRLANTDLSEIKFCKAKYNRYKGFSF